MKAPTLETKRLRLRNYKIEDFENFAKFYMSSRSIYADGPVSRATAWSWFAAGSGRWRLVGSGAWAVDRINDDVCVGVVSLNHPVNYTEESELGWFLWEEYEGQGYAAEAAAEAKRFAFSNLCWPALVSYIDVKNSKSIDLAIRLGASLDEEATKLTDSETLVYRHHKVG